MKLRLCKDLNRTPPLPLKLFNQQLHQNMYPIFVHLKILFEISSFGFICYIMYMLMSLRVSR